MSAVIKISLSLVTAIAVKLSSGGCLQLNLKQGYGKLFVSSRFQNLKF